MDARLRAGPHVFVEDLDRLELDDTDDRHLRRALRLRPGAALTVGDGAGRWRPARLAAMPGHLEVADDVVVDPRPWPPVRVAFAPVKGDRTEWAVAKLTEVGVDEIVVVATARSVVRWDTARAARHGERLQRVLREAAMQSRRTWMPDLRILTDLRHLVADTAPAAGSAWRPADPDGTEPPRLPTSVVVGPEGGFTDEELTTLGPPVRLGPQILRTETAAVVAAALLVVDR
ncbi:MAG: 16S rRNA (uracil(1498)-N(3))-methyltransferase [Acidimicrobiia bacterium]|nr:16S rRNA (uracil(1498)-N(3))-methyltransferase [Acidimicrobiia bacterium]